MLTTPRHTSPAHLAKLILTNPMPALKPKDFNKCAAVVGDVVADAYPTNVCNYGGVSHTLGPNSKTLNDYRDNIINRLAANTLWPAGSFNGELDSTQRSTPLYETRLYFFPF